MGVQRKFMENNADEISIKKITTKVEYPTPQKQKKERNWAPAVDPDPENLAFIFQSRKQIFFSFYLFFV